MQSFQKAKIYHTDNKILTGILFFRLNFQAKTVHYVLSPMYSDSASVRGTPRIFHTEHYRSVWVHLHWGSRCSFN